MELPLLIQCTRVFLQVLPCCSTLYIVLRVIMLRHSWGLYWELSVFPVGQPHSDQIAFGPLPLSKKSTIHSTLMVYPSMPGIICVWQICDGLNRVPLHYIPHKNIVQALHDVKARCPDQNSGTSMGVDPCFVLKL